MPTRLALPLLAALLLAGCAGGDLASRNERNLKRIGVGMTREHVHSIMRTEPRAAGVTGAEGGRYAHRIESYEAGGRTWEVFLFQNERAGPNEAVEDENLTPIVLLDGLVVGWGWQFWKDAASKNGITLRSP